ncbi:MAG: sodium:calcium antiporter [Pirellulales bacterium]|nr:sodium:calcium antiporter [Pirellulales bacterium]
MVLSPGYCTMDEQLKNFFLNQSPWMLGIEIAAILAVLAKAADWLVGESVVLSERSGLPKVVIGATIVSLGTTAPEAAVSVLAATHGNPDVSLGNAIGSIICDTGLILGIACLIMPLKMPRKIVNSQGWLQFGAGWLLVAACWPWATGNNPLQGGGNLSQRMGFVFLGLLVGYICLSIHWAKAAGGRAELEKSEANAALSLPLLVAKLLVAILLVVGASHVLIPAIHEAATRLGVSGGIVAATLIAFGTSLPELVTAVTAARRNHGDLAIGNIIGADILNVLFVAGMSAAVTPAGLAAPPEFFRILLPGMLLILVVFRVGVSLSGDRMERPLGALLLVTYVAIMVTSYTVLGAAGK